MNTMTISNARRSFGALLDAVQHRPVVIRRRNRDVCVIMSIEEYERIQHLETKDPKWAQVDPETDGS